MPVNDTSGLGGFIEVRMRAMSSPCTAVLVSAVVLLCCSSVPAVKNGEAHI